MTVIGCWPVDLSADEGLVDSRFGGETLWRTTR